MKTRKVLDAFALLAYLEGERGHARVRDLLASDDADLLINAVNAGEVFYVLARKRAPDRPSTS